MAPPELIPGGIPLAQIAELSAGQSAALSGCWIETAQELLAVAAGQESSRQRVAELLGVDIEGLYRLLAAAQALVAPARTSTGAALVSSPGNYGRGLVLRDPDEEAAHQATLVPYAPPGVRTMLPDGIEHLGELPPLRDQGLRGTCVAHAVLAVREHLEILAGSPPDIDLSEQFVYWWCKQHDGIPRVTGTFLSVGMRCLAEAGAPLEGACPYISMLAEDQQLSSPPPAAAGGDPAFRTLHTTEFNRADIAGIKSCLYEGRLVAFAVPIFDSWYYSSATTRWGKITMPLPGEQPNGGHALTLVGYQDDAAAPGGGYFLIRNSWRPWAYEATRQSGYGYIPYGYLARYAQGVFSADRVPDADILVRDSADDSGARPCPAPTWDSPDIWLRQATDGGTTHQAPAAGQANYLYVRVGNNGPAYTYEVQVDLFAAPLAPAIAEDTWVEIGHASAPRIAAGGRETIGPIPWIPSNGQAYAFQARVASTTDALRRPLDLGANNNLGQRNSWVPQVAVGSSAELRWPANVALYQLQRGDLPDAIAVDVLGGTEGDGLRVSVPVEAEPGVRYTFTVAQLQSGQVTGRLTVDLEVAALTAS